MLAFHREDACPFEARVVSAFQGRYGSDPAFVVRAPGRVNLIGEHTDYNDGFVLPMAIDRAVWIALRPRADRRVAVHSLDYDETARVRPRTSSRTKDADGWIEYLKGTAWACRTPAIALSGWEGVSAGDVPLGAGLSSSAALEMATARAFAAVAAFPGSPPRWPSSASGPRTSGSASTAASWTS